MYLYANLNFHTRIYFCTWEVGGVKIVGFFFLVFLVFFFFGFFFGFFFNVEEMD